MAERIMEQTMTNPVTIDFKRDNSGEWRVVGGGSAKSHKTTVEGVSNQQLIFALTQDMIQKGYRFDVNDPIWVAVDNGQCPPSGASNGQITLVPPATASQVTVSDANSTPVVLRYQLNVFDENGNSAPIDPIIDNRGGGGI
jgi:hypothetical protein